MRVEVIGDVRFHRVGTWVVEIGVLGGRFVVVRGESLRGGSTW